MARLEGICGSGEPLNLELRLLRWAKASGCAKLGVDVLLTLIQQAW
jgi:hypothetical protein